jgi:hypothetical protein
MGRYASAVAAASNQASVKRIIQFTSQVAPPSAEKACSRRAKLAVIPTANVRI